MKVIITGSTGMVGKGILLECLDSPKVEKVLIINRTSLQMKHSKLEEIVLKDFTQLETISDKLGGYDACFYCIGISAATMFGVKEERYTQVTYGLTKIFADVLFDLNPQMVFNYISGAGTDSSEKGRIMWTRVKGKAENYILNKGFRDAYAFRPGAIIPERGVNSKTKWYNILYVLASPFFGLMKKSKNVTTTTKVGRAMINSVQNPQELKHLKSKDINLLAVSLNKK